MSMIYCCDFCGKNEKEVSCIVSSDPDKKDAPAICTECVFDSFGLIKQHIEEKIKQLEEKQE